MTSPSTPWSAFTEPALALFRDAGTAGTAAFERFAEQAPAGQARYAQWLKAMLDAGNECSALQGAAGFGLLQAQLRMLGTPRPGPAVRGLLDLQCDFLAGVCSGWKTTLDRLAARSDGCIADLRAAADGDDVPFVLAAFQRDVDAVLRKESEAALGLLNAMGATATVLARRALDELIDAAKPAKGDGAAI